ncbi:hypothetical protein ACOME3_009776 [Neoechinorhynchus agilis]
MKNLTQYLTCEVQRNLQHEHNSNSNENNARSKQSLLSSCSRQCGSWLIEVHGLCDSTVERAKTYFENSIKCDRQSYKAHSVMASFNYDLVIHYKKQSENNTVNGRESKKQMIRYAAQAIDHFFESVLLSNENQLQNLLRLLTVWFKFGDEDSVADKINERKLQISETAWLQVIPQLIARIDCIKSKVRESVQKILIQVGKRHPQALIYPLAVTSKSNISTRSQAANEVLSDMCKHSKELVEQALLWQEALDEASRMYFNGGSVHGFFDILEPLHVMIEKGAETKKEKNFIDIYGPDLCRAHTLIKLFSHDQQELSDSWNLYYNVFQKITQQVREITVLDLKYVSPKLLNCKDLELAVPGTYNPSSVTYGAPKLAGIAQSHGEVISIRGFSPKVEIIASKQRPRKINIFGSNGEEYQFLLKGHEDIRQDQRVMQLFHLINNILLSSEDQHIHDLSICRYSTIPLAPNNGLIGWVPHCDTLHSLIKEYREGNNIRINLEHQMMQLFCPDFESRPLIVKVEIFEQILHRTNSDDLACILWQRSSTAENWCARKHAFDRYGGSNFTRSLAVMSMVGYILGLGDRHPSNIMINRASGKVVHIDFGDCFEVAINREKFPETVPFRLTRMLIGAMEVTGLDGTFRITCETVMRVLRMHRDNLLAVLEAFVYDPVISWRLLTPKKLVFGTKVSTHIEKTLTESPAADVLNNPQTVSHMQMRLELPFGMKANTDQQKQSTEDINAIDIDNSDLLDAKAIAIVDRVKDKLSGRDFCCCLSTDCQGSLSITAPCSNPTKLPHTKQVDKLIREAVTSENLCQVYIGWCPFW